MYIHAICVSHMVCTCVYMGCSVGVKWFTLLYLKLRPFPLVSLNCGRVWVPLWESVGAHGTNALYVYMHVCSHSQHNFVS